MSPTQIPEAILVADCGTALTKVVLVDVVEGDYRFIACAQASTTGASVDGDLTIGLQRAIRAIESTTGRQLVRDRRLIMPLASTGDGVDSFLALSSAGRPLSVYALGLKRDKGIDVASQAAEGVPAKVMKSVLLDEGSRLEKGKKPFQDIVDDMRRVAPDVVIIGADGKAAARELAIAQELVDSAWPDADSDPQAPTLICAGTQQAAEAVVGALREHFDVRVVPALQTAAGQTDTGALMSALGDVYVQRRVASLPGGRRLGEWSDLPLSTSQKALGVVARFIGQQHKREVVVVDVGSGGTSVHYAGDGKFLPVLSPGLGVGASSAEVINQAGAPAIARWLPFGMTQDDIRAWAAGHKDQGGAKTDSVRDRLIEQAFAREAARASLSRLYARVPDLAVDLLVACGGTLAASASPGQAALALLDAVEPTGQSTGSVELTMDNTYMMSAIGAMAGFHPDAAAAVFDRDCLTWLGTCVVPLGTDKPGSLAAHVTLEYVGGGTVEADVPYGSIRVIPLRVDQRASLTVQPGRNFRIGQSPKGKLVKTRPGEEIKGGLVGLIVDARGRPIELPADGLGHAAKVLEWMKEIGSVGSDTSFQA